MSGLEVLSAVAATAEIIKIVIAARDHCQRAVAKWEALEQARAAGIAQLSNLRAVFNNIASTLNKYHKDVEHSLGRSDRAALREKLKDIKRVAGETCDRTIPRFSVAVRQPKVNTNELKEIQNELNFASEMHVEAFANNLICSYLQMETFRRVSIGQSDTAQLTRQDTSLSNAPTLTRIPTSSTTASKSSTGSSSKSTSSTRSLRFYDDKQLCSAIQMQDISEVENIMEAVEDESEIESRKASALLLACRYRRPSIVQALLIKGADITVTDKEGRGVLHNVIGTSDSVNEARDKQVVKILQLLVKDYAPVNARLLNAREPKQKQIPLHYCARSGNHHAASYILSVDPAVVDIKDAKEKTALYHACEHGSPSGKLVKLLL
ncbi:MAG: hypothetical protein Q9181_007588, partial [Wetmoreana brouardii]